MVFNLLRIRGRELQLLLLLHVLGRSWTSLVGSVPRRWRRGRIAATEGGAAPANEIRTVKMGNTMGTTLEDLTRPAATTDATIRFETGLARIRTDRIVTIAATRTIGITATRGTMTIATSHTVRTVATATCRRSSTSLAATKPRSDPPTARVAAGAAVEARRRRDPVDRRTRRLARRRLRRLRHPRTPDVGGSIVDEAGAAAPAPVLGVEAPRAAAAAGAGAAGPAKAGADAARTVATGPSPRNLRRTIVAAETFRRRNPKIAVVDDADQARAADLDRPAADRIAAGRKRARDVHRESSGAYVATIKALLL
jgi:hypothetical protein